MFGEVDWMLYQEDQKTPVSMASEANSEGSWLQRIFHGMLRLEFAAMSIDNGRRSERSRIPKRK
jgi:hypothetical protein